MTIETAIIRIIDNWDDWQAEAMQDAQAEQDYEAGNETMRRKLRDVLEKLAPDYTDKSQLIHLLDKSRTALRIVAAGIWRNRESNACGLAGPSVAVHAVEDVLAEMEAYIEGTLDDDVCYCGMLMRDHHQGSSCTTPRAMPRGDA